jgi:hypothetical protein
LSKECGPNLIKNIEDYIRKKEKKKKPQNVYIDTIPLLNPVAENQYETDSLYVSVYTEGYCQECHKTIVDNIDSSITINLQKLKEHKEDLLITVVGDSIICPHCGTIIEKGKLVVKDIVFKRVVLEKNIKSLHILGNMNKQDNMKILLQSAVNGEAYFTNHQEKFWSAFSYIALQDWNLFISELTRIELKKGLTPHFDDLDEDVSKAQLLKKLKMLSLTENQQENFWRIANEDVVQYYLFITVFGWNIRKETEMIGPNRAEFIFHYLPLPKELDQLRQKVLSEHILKTPQEIKRIQDTINNQQQQMQVLRQENGRLSHKLGEAYERISQLEKEKITVSDEERNKDDILKIQHLKGLIEELKSEIVRLSIDVVPEDVIEEVGLTDEPIEQEVVPLDIALKGKNILILGGYRNKQTIEEKGYTIYTHDTRTIDPAFYDLLKKTDIIVILTRFISHRATWEAKEFAILEQKPIYFSSFTNIPTILNEIVGKGKGGGVIGCPSKVL